MEELENLQQLLEEKEEEIKNNEEMIITLREENEQLQNRVSELEKWMEEAIASLNYVL